jgi:hypothetical protein
MESTSMRLENPCSTLPLVIEERLKRREGFSMAKARSHESLDLDGERTPVMQPQ